ISTSRKSSLLRNTHSTDPILQFNVHTTISPYGFGLCPKRLSPTYLMLDEMVHGGSNCR
ncbi:hypothetical protein BgiMline_000356, partial [Biomphalaria glabrata]